MLPCYYPYMTTHIVIELLKLRHQLDQLIDQLRMEEAPELEEAILQAFQQLPNPAPAAQLREHLNTIRTTPISHKKLAATLKALGCQLHRRAAGNFYYHPSCRNPRDTRSRAATKSARSLTASS